MVGTRRGLGRVCSALLERVKDPQFSEIAAVLTSVYLFFLSLGTVLSKRALYLGNLDALPKILLVSCRYLGAGQMAAC